VDLSFLKIEAKYIDILQNTYPVSSNIKTQTAQTLRQGQTRQGIGKSLPRLLRVKKGSSGENPELSSLPRSR
jgi:hypothetical protein